MTATETVLDLGPTATYAVRVAVWLPTPGGGILTLALSRTAGGKLELDRYDCDEQPPPAFGVREFLLVNLDDATQPDAYAVVVSAAGVTCTCTAGRVRRACKHSDFFKAFFTGENRD